MQITAAYSPADIAKIEAPKLREMAAVLGTAMVEESVYGNLISFLRYAGVSELWHDDMVMECALGLAHANGHLSMAQWAHFWKRCKSGHFTWYGGLKALTPMIVESWMKHHAAECEEANETAVNDREWQRSQRPETGDYVPAEKISAAMQQFIKDMGGVQDEKEGPLPARTMDYYEQRELLKKTDQSRQDYYQSRDKMLDHEKNPSADT